MEAILISIAADILTWLCGKLKISKTYLSIGLCLVLGTAYYLITTYYAADWKELVAFVGGVYASSQLIYNICVKLNIFGKKE